MAGGGEKKKSSRRTALQTVTSETKTKKKKTETKTEMQMGRVMRMREGEKRRIRWKQTLQNVQLSWIGFQWDQCSEAGTNTETELNIEAELNPRLRSVQ